MKLSEDLREHAKTWSEDSWLNAWADQAEGLENQVQELERRVRELEKELESWKESRNELARLVGIRREY